MNLAPLTCHDAMFRHSTADGMSEREMRGAFSSDAELADVFGDVAQ